MSRAGVNDSGTPTPPFLVIASNDINEELNSGEGPGGEALAGLQKRVAVVRLAHGDRTSPVPIVHRTTSTPSA
jgi:hypothetical protein